MITPAPVAMIGVLSFPAMSTPWCQAFFPLNGSILLPNWDDSQPLVTGIPDSLISFFKLSLIRTFSKMSSWVDLLFSSFSICVMSSSM